MAQRVLAESHGHRGPLDWLGALSFTLSAGSVTFALIHGGEAGWGSGTTIVAFAVAGVALVAFLAIEPRRLSPLMDLRLMRDPSFATLMLAAVAAQRGRVRGRPLHPAVAAVGAQSVRDRRRSRGGAAGGGGVCRVRGCRALHAPHPAAVPARGGAAGDRGRLAAAHGDLRGVRLGRADPGAGASPGSVWASPRPC